MTYRKKPVEIEAVQWKGDNFHEILALNIGSGVYVWEDYFVIVPTLEGDMTAILDDWIIKGVKGEIYPCKPDIFELTYDKVG